MKTKGLIFDIKRYAIHDGPGIRTTVFFKGCPLQCQWCHNPESWRSEPELGVRQARCIRCGQCAEVCTGGAISLVENGPPCQNGALRPVTDASKCTLCGKCVEACVAGAREIIGREVTVGEVMAEIEKDVIFYDQSGGGVTFSGGEPLMQPEFLRALLNQCQGHQIHTAVDTCCYAEPEILETTIQGTDLYLCDLKHIDSEMHRRLTGVGNELILENIKRISQAGKEIVIRIPVIPRFNDDKANIEATGKFAALLPGVIRIDILPYNRGGNEKSARLASGIELVEAETPDEEKMNSIAERLGNYGFEVKTGG